MSTVVRNLKLVKLVEMLMMEDLRVVHVLPVAIRLAEEVRRWVGLLGKYFGNGSHLKDKI